VLLGDSFHPGGLPLTERLGELLGLDPGSQVLDVAAGRGTSGIFLAQRFGCTVVGVDYSAQNVALAAEAAALAGARDRVTFREEDAERLQAFGDGTFDAVVCECALCTFPDKPAAAQAMARVLRPGGRLGLSDLTRSGPLSADLETLLAWVACVADARPVEDYVGFLRDAGLEPAAPERHDDALRDLMATVRGKLIGAELLVNLKRLTLPGADFTQAKVMARAAMEAVNAGTLGYMLVVAQKPGG
jgi:ubiquinone/menaquinone biosynthesis C-methylase UbiE